MAFNTPFCDGQALKGCGVDCAHFPAKVCEEAGVLPHIDIPYYSPQIYKNRLGDDTYLQMILQFTREIEEREVQPADFVLFSFRRKQPFSYTHGGIIERWPDSFIHPLRPHGVMCSAAWEGFAQRLPRRFFSLFPEAK